MITTLSKPSADRNTKYITAVRQHMEKVGHATNLELIESLRSEFPGVSATTVHRVTSRMVERGELQFAPTASGGVMRFDANCSLHDHFVCESCGLIRDANIGDTVRPILEKSIGEGCSISGSLTVYGTCKTCKKEGV